MLEVQPVRIQSRPLERVLEIEFDDGKCFTYTAEYLRTQSPSAEVKGHGNSQRRVIECSTVGITAIEPVGNYAIRIIFDDRHNTGIYSWSYLYELGK